MIRYIRLSIDLVRINQIDYYFINEDHIKELGRECTTIGITNGSGHCFYELHKHSFVIRRMFGTIEDKKEFTSYLWEKATKQKRGGISYSTNDIDECKILKSLGYRLIDMNDDKFIFMFLRSSLTTIT